MNDCCLKQAGSGFEGLCEIPLPKHSFSDPLEIQTSNAVFIKSYFPFKSFHIQFGCLSLAEKFRASFTDNDKSEVNHHV